MFKVTACLLLSLFSLLTPAIAQNASGRILTHSCSYYGEALSTQHLAETPLGPDQTRNIIKEIIDVVGLKPRFEIRAANVPNAAAVIYNNKRYILYNQQFVNAINSAVKTDWAGVSILAHEIGHHLNGHTLEHESQPELELEADEFSGFVLRKMGASLEQAQAAMRALSDEEGSATHPPRRYRLAAIMRGWQNSEAQIAASRSASPLPQSEQPKMESPTTSRVTSLPIDRQFLLGKFYLSANANEPLFLTTRLNIIKVVEGEIQIVGKLTKSDNQQYPYMLSDQQSRRLYVTRQGNIVNRQNHKVGFLQTIS
jgi:hypothetical protein